MTCWRRNENQQTEHTKQWIRVKVVWKWPSKYNPPLDCEEEKEERPQNSQQQQQRRHQLRGKMTRPARLSFSSSISCCSPWRIIMDGRQAALFLFLASLLVLLSRPAASVTSGTALNYSQHIPVHYEMLICLSGSFLLVSLHGMGDAVVAAAASSTAVYTIDFR